MAPTFRFVRIPHDVSQPIEELTGDTSGGLSNDYLVAHAKKYFAKSSKPTTLSDEQVDALPPEQKKQLANQIREQVKQSQQQFLKDSPDQLTKLESIEDEVLLNMYKSSSGSSAGTCDIVALTIPMPNNGNHAVSMYVPVNASENSPNERAVALLTACGHAGRTINGDVFVGRAHDDEVADIWIRIDFTAEDTDPRSEWCAVARSKLGGGGQGNESGAHSLHGTVSNMLTQQGTQIQSSGGGGTINAPISSLSESLPANDNQEHVADGYVWSQNDDEVEIKMAVPAGTKSKYVKVNFQHSSIKVTVTGQTLIQGTLGGNIIKDDSTYTIQDSEGNDEKRELCITLGKEASGRVWTCAVKKQ